MFKRLRVLRSERKIIGPLIVVNPDSAGIDAGSDQHWVSVPRRSGRATRSSVRNVHGRSECPGRLARGAWDQDRGDRSERGCTGSRCSKFSKRGDWRPSWWTRAASGAEQEEDGCGGLPVDSAVAHATVCSTERSGRMPRCFHCGPTCWQRRMLIEYASAISGNMQKALDLMNLKLHLVISDITGVSGLRIIHAILVVSGIRRSWPRCASRLAKTRNRRSPRPWLGTIGTSMCLHSSRPSSCSRSTAGSWRLVTSRVDAALALFENESGPRGSWSANIQEAAKESAPFRRPLAC